MHWTNLLTPTESQNKLVLHHLIKYGDLTSIQAIRLYSITRLASRISDLRRSGHDIKSTLLHDKANRSIHYSIYSLNIPTK